MPSSDTWPGAVAFSNGAYASALPSRRARTRAGSATSPMGMAITFFRPRARRNTFTPCVSESHFAAILTTAGCTRARSAATRRKFWGVRWKKCAEAICRPSPSSTSSNSGGHFDEDSISRSYQVQPAAIASARWTSCFAIVPANFPPALAPAASNYKCRPRGAGRLAGAQQR